MTGWEQMWSKGLAPGQAFDASRTEPAFARLLEQASVDPPLPAVGSKALVPGCGRGYAVVSLERAGYVAEGLEIAPTAAKVAEAYIRSQGAVAVVRTGDFFGLELERQYDFVFDSTFLCALPPSLREDWATMMAGIISPGGQLITNIFPIREDNEPDPADGDIGSGPPYALSPSLVERLLTRAGFVCLGMEPVADSLRARGRREVLARWRAPASQ
ncbi:S-adenosyl-L-methionine-dependent methyltransferase [Pavlovales sp. CCMP2436]|nr:S-adenosyl-L-methionine-dependent methyltransferase [Pavlovales sp. CCMP2436]|mmetsp:Transcript_35518/g.88346  ORF Transcript_35518/g.88346 Transcript_35518/m.88346 type:complete len:215 (+) Transcript_35518:138-782(+)